MGILSWTEPIEKEIENEPITLSAKLESVVNHLDHAIAGLKSIGFTCDNSSILEDIVVCADKLNITLMLSMPIDRLK